MLPDGGTRRHISDDPGKYRIVDGLLTNVYRSFYLRDESTIYDRLAITTSGDQLTDIYLEMKKGRPLWMALMQLSVLLIAKPLKQCTGEKSGHHRACLALELLQCNILTLNNKLSDSILKLCVCAFALGLLGQTHQHRCG